MNVARQKRPCGVRSQYRERSPGWGGRSEPIGELRNDSIEVRIAYGANLVADKFVGRDVAPLLVQLESHAQVMIIARRPAVLDSRRQAVEVA